MVAGGLQEVQVILVIHPIRTPVVPGEVLTVLVIPAHMDQRKHPVVQGVNALISMEIQ